MNPAILISLFTTLLTIIGAALAVGVYRNRIEQLERAHERLEKRVEFLDGRLDALNDRVIALKERSDFADRTGSHKSPLAQSQRYR